MGSYAVLSLDDYEIDSAKNWSITQQIPFIESDRQFQYPKDQNDINTHSYKYRISREVALKRLESMGYTEEKFKDFFKLWQQKYNEKYGQITPKVNVLCQSLTPEKWTMIVRFYLLMGDKIKKTDINKIMFIDNNGLTIDDRPWIMLGSIMNPITLSQILRAGSFLKYLEFDITEPVQSEWIDLSLPFLEETIGDFWENEKPVNEIIVLTEGSSDTNCIKAAMQVYYPEHFLKFKFIDPERFKLPGGSGNLTNYVKFMYTVMPNDRKVIAILDNDIAGHESKKVLEKAKLPESFETIILPDVNIAKNYPVLHNEKTILLDVNGAACSIELMLGKECLSDKSGLRPVKMKRLGEKRTAGSGEITQKGKVSKKFLNIMKKQGSKKYLAEEALGMIELLDSIVEISKASEIQAKTEELESFMLADF